MLKLALYSLVLLSGSANGNWEDGRNDSSHEGLGFYAMNLECNDKQSACSKCFKGRVSEGPFKVIEHVFEYTKDPYKIELNTEVVNNDVQATFIQEDPSEKFHFCIEMTEDKAVPSGGLYHGKVNLCLENDFSGLSVPAECPTPVAATRAEASANDMKPIGQQVLYCMQ
ncbi:uncharacterized protein LOC119740520 [Patiria miniata]|uniref:Uncharacterized protein n=1 Tax=Patiria miniata TaxID=46514 RepID=A0A914B752_PATMI|nr:uncharacterized protein LOC119740520 [Patiria miniata]